MLLPYQLSGGGGGKGTLSGETRRGRGEEDCELFVFYLADLGEAKTRLGCRRQRFNNKSNQYACVARFLRARKTLGWPKATT